MADFLLELLSEEIPARMQPKARNDLARLFAECTSEAGLSTGAVDVHSTPRRLVLIARDVADATEASREEVKGPRANAPEQAVEGFLRKTGLKRDQLEERDGVLFAVIEREGKAAGDVLAETVERIVADFPWPKSMRWATGDLRWVRPLHGIVAMLGETIVPIEIDGIASGATTVGHRFHHPGPITVGGAADYVEKLRACHVIVDQAERERLIAEGAAKAAAVSGTDLDRGPGAGGRECRAHRMARAADRPLRPRLSRRAARGDRAHHAHQPEIFRLYRGPTDCSRQPSSALRTSARKTAARPLPRATPGFSLPVSRTRASSGSRM
jgi:glycyl-tRNA synthetase beta chain